MAAFGYGIAKLRGIPTAFLLRKTPHDFKQEDLDHFINQRIPGASGFLVGLVGLEEYHSGESSRTFYVGNDDRFHGKLLVQSTQEEVLHFRARVFTNHREVSPTTAEDGSSPLSSIYGSLSGLGKVEFPIDIAGLHWGINDVQIIVMDTTAKTALVEKGPPRGYFSPVNAVVIQIIRGSKIQSAAESYHYASGATSSALPCEGGGLNYYIEESTVGVNNCDDKDIEGVFLFPRDSAGNIPSPLYYRAPTRTLVKLGIQVGFAPMEAFHILSPFQRFENWHGRQSYFSLPMFGIQLDAGPPDSRVTRVEN